MSRTAATRSTAPLAERMRPRQLDEVVGQDHLLAPGAPLRTLLEAGRPPSMVFWGPPGVGKTTLARLVAQHVDAQFISLSAVLAGVKEIRETTAQALAALQGLTPRRTVLFVDEIHRFNKGQQDALLPYVEDGTVVLIGATTENPSFELNSALLSRLRVFVLRALDEPAIGLLLQRALVEPLGIAGQSSAQKGLVARGKEQSGFRACAIWGDSDWRPPDTWPSDMPVCRCWPRSPALRSTERWRRARATRNGSRAKRRAPVGVLTGAMPASNSDRKYLIALPNGSTAPGAWAQKVLPGPRCPTSCSRVSTSPGAQRRSNSWRPKGPGRSMWC